MANVPISNFTVPANTVGIGATGYSLTGSASASFVDLAGTWNTSGTPTLIKANVTDTASNASSLLMDLQVGGSSRININKSGVITGGSVSAIRLPTTSFSYIANVGIAYSGQNSIDFNSAGVINWSSSGAAALPSTPDRILSRRAAANLRLGAADAAAPVAQTLSVQSVVAGTTNTAGANLTITGSQGTGTGAGGSIIFQVAPAGAISGGAVNPLATALQVYPTGAIGNALTGFNIETQSGSSTFGGAPVWRQAGGSDGYVVTRGDGRNVAFNLGSLNMRLSSTGALSWYNSGDHFSAALDLFLARDAANTLALRNGANAQTLNVYNTWSAADNFERFRIVAQSGGSVLIGTQKGTAGGTARALEFQTDGVTRLTIATTGAVTVNGSTSINSYDVNCTNSFQRTGRFALFSATSGCITLSDATTFTSFDRLQFGGATSSFPALKRAATSLQARLADDSDFTNIQGKLTTETAYTAGAPTATGYLIIYDSTGTAYRVPAVAN